MRTSPIVRQMIRAENSATIRHLSPGMAVTVSGLKGSAVVERASPRPRASSPRTCSYGAAVRRVVGWPLGPTGV